MSMMKEIEKMMLDVGVSTDYRIINLGGKSLYVEGIKTVVDLGTEQMLFQLKKRVLKIFGTDLSVKYLDNSTCVIVGEILAVEVK